MREITVAILILAAQLAFAQGGPPLVTDDPETPGNGKWEINLALLLEKEKAGKTFEAPHLDLNYGLGERIQLKFSLQFNF